MLGRFPQSGALGSQAGAGVQRLHPRRVTAPGASLRFLIGEAGQAAQMTPIGAAHVTAVEVGQVFADLAGNRSFDGCGTDVHPSLEIAGTGLQYDTGFMTSGPHGLDDGWVGAIEIHEDVAGIAVLREGMEVHVAALAVANTQEADGGRTGQLGSAPQPLSGESPSGLGVNETNEIEVVRHGRELAANGLRGEIESEVEHGLNFGIEGTRRTMNSQRTANSGLTDCLSLGVHRSHLDGFVDVVNLESGNWLPYTHDRYPVFNTGSQPILDLQFADDDERNLFVLRADGMLSVWNVETGRALGQWNKVFSNAAFLGLI